MIMRLNCPPHLQAKLLRVLQERRVRRIGDTVEHAVDVRVIAATNRNLEEMIRNGDFREDLYYRLNVVPIHIPSLRQHKGDIPILAEYLVKKFNRRLNKNIKNLLRHQVRIAEENIMLHITRQAGKRNLLIK